MQIAYAYRFTDEPSGIKGVVHISSRFQHRYFTPSEIGDLRYVPLQLYLSVIRVYDPYYLVVFIAGHLLKSDDHLQQR